MNIPFNTSAQKVIASCREEAGERFHNYIGTEHLLFAILKDVESEARKLLCHIGLSTVLLRHVLNQMVDPPAMMVIDVSGIPFTPRAKKVCAFATKESLEFNREQIGCEHILLGILKEGEGIAARAMFSLGISYDSAKQKCMEIYPPIPIDYEAMHEKALVKSHTNPLCLPSVVEEIGGMQDNLSKILKGVIAKANEALQEICPSLHMQWLSRVDDVTPDNLDLNKGYISVAKIK